MKRILLSKAQKKEMDRIVKFFMEAVEPIEEPGLRAIVASKILSRLGCFCDRLTEREVD